MEPSPTIAPGTLLAGKYRVDRLLGEGGMGIVLAATNEALRQRVAIKLLRAGALANAQALGRFEREARAAASLRSEHVARVLDVGKLDDGLPYMVMEYLEGRDLGDVIDQEGPLPISDAIDFVVQACEAIAEAHAAGIIHRDLKPKNMFLANTVDGRPLVKVLDFGISKMDDGTEDMSLTRTTEIIGSPSYMSPEQLRSSKDVDVRTDIWALGIILYELLTSRVPFVASTVTELVAVVLTDPIPDVRALRPDVPEALADAITRGCLSRRRDERFASVADLVRTIAPFGQGDVGVPVADRVARVAAGSGRLPPTTGSGPHAVRSVTSPVAGLDSSRSEPPARSTDGLVSAPALIPPATPSGAPLAHGGAPPPASSARLAIHGGTSVAWGATQVDVPRAAAAPPLPPPRRARWPWVVAAGALLVGGAGAGALLYAQRVAPKSTAALLDVSASLPPSATPLPPSATPLPEGRKDLPPLATVAATEPEPEPEPEPSIRPTAAAAPPPSTRAATRGPMATKPTHARPKPPRPKSAPAGSRPATGAQSVDLSDIGRR